MSIFDPLPTNYDFRTLQNMFGGIPKPGDIRDMYTRIFGPITNGVSNMREFSGAGRSEIVDNTNLSQVGSNLIIRPHVTRYKVDAKIRVEYAVDLADIGTGSSLKTGIFTYTTDGQKEITVAVGAGSYYYRIEFWNAFNPNEFDHEFTITLQATLSNPTLANPSLLSTITYDSVDNGYLLKWNTTGDEPTGYDFEYRLNSGAWTAPTSVTDQVNWNTSPASTKEAQIQVSSVPNPSDVYEFRLRATRAGYTSSGWSNIQSFTH